MNTELKTKIENIIEDAIESELSYQKDYITHAGWSFLEDKAAKLVLNKIERNYDDEEEIAELAEQDMEQDIQYFAELLMKYFIEPAVLVRLGGDEFVAFIDKSVISQKLQRI